MYTVCSSVVDLPTEWPSNGSVDSQSYSFGVALRLRWQLSDTVIIDRVHCGKGVTVKLESETVIPFEESLSETKWSTLTRDRHVIPGDSTRQTSVLEGACKGVYLVHET